MHMRPVICRFVRRSRVPVLNCRFISSGPDPHLPSAALNSYQSKPPSQASLDNAHRFLANGPVSFLFSAAKLTQFPPLSSAPEIAFLGRSNVGKSSMLNALLNRKSAKLAHESKNPGRTKTMNVFGVGGATEGAGGRRVVTDPGTSLELLRKSGKKGTEVRNFIGKGGLAVVDCPGYGYGSRGEWGEAVIRYLEKREQLARVFLLIDVKVGLKKSDDAILKILREAGTPHQIVLSKVDRILFPKGRLDDMSNLPERLVQLRTIQDEIRERIFGGDGSANPDVICTSSNDFALGSYKRIGIGELQVAVLEAAGLMSMEKEIAAATAGTGSSKNGIEEERYEGVVGWDQLETISDNRANVRTG